MFFIQLPEECSGRLKRLGAYLVEISVFFVGSGISQHEQDRFFSCERNVLENSHSNGFKRPTYDIRTVEHHFM